MVKLVHEYVIRLYMMPSDPDTLDKKHECMCDAMQSLLVMVMDDPQETQGRPF